MLGSLFSLSHPQRPKVTMLQAETQQGHERPGRGIRPALWEQTLQKNLGKGSDDGWMGIFKVAMATW